MKQLVVSCHMDPVEICGRCSKPLEDSKYSICIPCLEILRHCNFGTLKEAQKAGKCLCCLRPRNSDKLKYYCSECSVRRNNFYRRQRQKRREEGFCNDCGASAEASVYCLDHWFRHCSSVNLGTTKRASELMALWVSQNKQCALTGEFLTPGINMSLDHIIAKINGGTNSSENIRWVTIVVNSAKHSLSDEDFLSLCSAVVTYRSTMRV